MILLCFVSHAPILNAGFVWDDHTLIAKNKYVHDLSHVPEFFVTDLGRHNLVPRDMGYYRPVQSASFALDWALFNGDPRGFHLVNLLIHCLAVLALFGIARRLGFDGLSAMFCAGLFAVLPAKSEEIFFIANRGGALAAMLALASLWAHLTDLREKKRWALPASLGFFLLALLTKETAIAVPGAIALITLFYFRDAWRNGETARWKLVGAAHWCAAAAYFVWRFAILKITPAEGGPAVGLFMAIRAIPEILLSYLRLLILPIGLTPDHPFAFRVFWHDPVVIFCWIGLLALAALVLLVRRAAPGLVFGLLLFGLLLSPVLNLIPLKRPFSEHYLYLPAAGFCLAAAALFARGTTGTGNVDRRTRRIALFLGAGLVVTYGLATARYATIWRDDCTLWSHAYKVEPGSDEAANNLGTCRFEAGDLDGAKKLFAEAFTIDPSNKKAAYNLAMASLNQREWDEAAGYLEHALRLDPEYTRALLAAGVAGYGTGKSVAELIEWARTLSPNWPEALLGYAHAAKEQGDPIAKEAEEVYKKLKPAGHDDSRG